METNTFRRSTSETPRVRPTAGVGDARSSFRRLKWHYYGTGQERSVCK